MGLSLTDYINKSLASELKFVKSEAARDQEAEDERARKEEEEKDELLSLLYDADREIF